MKYHNYRNLFSLVSLSILMVACAGSPKQTPSPLTDEVPYQVTEDYTVGVISYTVQRGDRLGDIALEFTGLSSNWREIAKHNNIANPRSLQEGSVLVIPTNMIPGYQQPTPPAPIIQPQTSQSMPTTQSTSLAIRRNTVAEIAPVLITPTNTNRDFDLTPIDPTASSQSRAYTGGGTQVKVIGTYYPKGIYTEPAHNSKLIMRVAPGTLFVLDSQVNDWYKIQTTGGSGYIRTNDAAIIE